MDPRLAYWTWALINMLCAVYCAVEGVRRIRRQEVRLHRRLMVAAGSLVILFVASYPFKLALLGKEKLGTWSDASIVLLRVHETCVLVMILAGGYAAVVGFRFLRSRDSGNDTGPSDTPIRSRHRYAGRLAVLASLLGVLTAGFVLRGMYIAA